MGRVLDSTSVDWAIEYLRNHPQAKMAQMIADQPDGVRVWPGVVAAAKATLGVPTPKRVKVGRKAVQRTPTPLPTAGTPTTSIRVVIQDTIKHLQSLLASLS